MKFSNKDFVHFHCHSEYSKFDGLAKIDELVLQARKMGFPALALTDHGNIQGWIKFLQQCRITKDKKGNDIPYPPIKPILGCLVGGQEIVTSQGIVPVEEVKEGDLVLTHKGRFKKIKRVMTRVHNGDLYEVELFSTKRKLKITGEHPILIRDSKGNVDWKKPTEIKDGRKDKKSGIREWNSYACLPKLIQKEKVEINVSDYLPNNLKCKNGYIQKIRKNNKCEMFNEWKNIPCKIEIDSDCARFLGLFVAEGSVVFKNEKINGAINLTFNYKEDEYANYVKNFIEKRFKLSVDIRKRKEKNTQDILFNCVPLAYVLYGLCGRGAKNKKIPVEIYECKREIKESFLNGLLGGDGKNINVKSNVFTQRTLKVSSKSLAWGARQLMADMGHWTSVADITEKRKNRREDLYYVVPYNPQRKYKRSIDDDLYIYKPVKKITKKTVEIQVYNFEVDEDNSYVSDCILHNCEMYLARKMDIGQNAKKVDTSETKKNQPDGRRGNRHINLYAMNFEGYKNICRMSQKSFRDGFYFDPRIDIDLMAKHSNGVMCGSACLSSVINVNLMYGRYDRAKKICGILNEIYKGNFFLEIMYHGINEERAILPLILKLSSELDIPVVCTNDSHYIYDSDGKSQEVLLCMSQQKCVKDPTRLQFGHMEFYLKSAEEMRKIFGHIPASLYNSVALSERIDTEDIEKNLFGGMRLPHFDIPSKYKNSYEYLSDLAWRGMKRIGWDKSRKHVDALKMELNDVFVAKENNNYDFATYFLIVRDYIQDAKSKGILVGCGRGCLSGDVKIIVGSEEKVKSIKDVEVGDEVVTRTGEYKKVVKTHVYNIDEKIINIKSYYGDFDGVTLTKDHKVLVEKKEFVDNFNNWGGKTRRSKKNCKEPTGNMEWIEASEIERGDWVFVPSYPFDFNREHNTNPILIDMGKKFSNEKDIIVEGTTVSEIRYVPNGGGVRNKKTFSRFCVIDEKFAWVLGKFAADGWLRKGEYRDNVVGFAFNKGEIDQVKKVKECFENRGINSFYENHSQTKNLIQVDVKSKYVYKLFHFLFDKYNCTSRTKHIPDIIFRSNKNIIASFLQGVFDGDGCAIDKYRKYTYSSTSKMLTYQLRELLRSQNIPCSVIKDRRNDSFTLCPIKHPILKYGINFNTNALSLNKFYKDIKHCKFVKGGMLLRVRSVNEVDGVNEVYDLTVEDESNYLTSSFIVHNSGYASVLLRCLDITYGVDPLEYGLLWERFLGFDDRKFIKETDFGFETDLVQQAVEKEVDRDLEDDLGGVDRY